MHFSNLTAATVVLAGSLSPVFSQCTTFTAPEVPTVTANLKAGQAQFDFYEGSYTTAQYYINPSGYLAGNISDYEMTLQCADNFTLGNWVEITDSASPFFGSAAKYISELPTDVEPKFLVPYEESVNELGSALDQYAKSLMALAPGVTAAAAIATQVLAADLARVTFDASV